MLSPTFLTLPDRELKPRSRGITHVIDGGVGVAEARSMLGASSAHMDIWKFGWGTAYLDGGLADKVALLAASQVVSCLGGTLLEIAWAQGRTDECLDWAQSAGIAAVEVSRGLVSMSLNDKRQLIQRAQKQFVVLSEVGSKDPSVAVRADEWGTEAIGDLEAGARWVVMEGRESGTVGLYSSDGAVRKDVVGAIERSTGIDKVIFEAPRKEQQVWFIQQFGPDVNLGNIPLSGTLSLETLRRGLRADTWNTLRQPVVV
ncbi:MAG: phosphosulfolactate synthase [Terrimesophilobacter sp.]